MKKNRIYFVGFSVWFLVLLSFFLAQVVHSEENKIQFYFNTIGFKNLTDPENTYQEVYVSVWNNQLTFSPKGEKYIGGYQITVTFFNQNRSRVTSQKLTGLCSLDSLKQAEEQVSLEVAGFSILPGKYILNIEISDLNSDIMGSEEKNIEVLSFKEEQLCLSEIEFSRSIKRSQDKNKFVKNKIEIIPYPSLVFGIESPFIFFYCEIYDLKEDNHRYIKEISVVDENMKSVYDGKNTLIAKAKNTVWVDKIKILQFESGKYTLYLTLTDQESGDIVSRESDFWVQSRQDKIPTPHYTEDDIETFRAQIYHIVNRKELNFFDNLELSGKIEFMNQFWKNRSPEFMREHLKRFNAVQKLYSAAKRQGWQSDRGRIYITYGPPDEISTYPANMDSRAHEIWIYESLKSQSQVVFVFCDFSIFGNYELIHSNLKSPEKMEIYNPNWRDEIKIAR